MDNKLREKLSNLDWKSILVELYAYAHARKKYPALQHSMSPEDLVNEAVGKVLSGERKWDYERHPDIVIHLKSVIKSIGSHALASEKAIKGRDAELVREANGATAESQMEKIDTESYYKSLLDEVEAELQDDEELLLMFYAMKEGHLKDKELVAALDIEIVAVRNAKKRMRRKLTEVKQRLGTL